jgi:hypothetical protein
MGGEHSVLVLEDLSHARWRAPVSVDDVEKFSTAADEIANIDVPSEIPPVDLDNWKWHSAWSGFVADSSKLIASGLVDQQWLDQYLAKAAAIESKVDIRGDSLAHGDLWLQNWCRTGDRGAVWVDWSGACRANSLLNRAWGECGIRAAGGPKSIVFPKNDDEPAWAMWMCGRTLSFAAEWHTDPRPRLVETLMREAAAALDWMSEACDLPRPLSSDAAIVHAAWRP